MVFEFGTPVPSTPAAPLFSDDPLIRQPKVASFTHGFHQPAFVRPSAAVAYRVVTSARRWTRPYRVPRRLLRVGGDLLFCFCLHRGRVDPTAYSRFSMFGPSVVLAPTMASADFCMRIPTPLDVGSTRHTCRSPRVLRTHLHAYACRIYVVAFRTSMGFDDFGHLTPLRRLVSASCSSGQRFAFGFLQIRSHPRHPCRSANSSPCRASRGLSPPSECALPGAHKKRGGESNPAPF